MEFEKITCGGFMLDSKVLEIQTDKESGKPVLTTTGNVPVAGSSFIILKGSDDSKLYKIAVKSGALAVEAME